MSKLWRLVVLAILAAPPAMTLASCGGSRALPSTLAVSVPDDCEKVLQDPPKVAPIKQGDDLGVAAARRGAALAVARGTITEGRGCIADQRKAEAAR